MAESDDADRGINTRLAHLGHDPYDYFGFINPPVVHASTVLYPDAATMVSRRQRYTYGTVATPTTEALASAVTALEGAAGTILAPSGLAAVTVPLLGFFLLPWTTLAYAVMWSASTNEVTGFEWFIVILAFLIDLGSWANRGRARRD